MFLTFWILTCSFDISKRNTSEISYRIAKLRVWSVLIYSLHWSCRIDARSHWHIDSFFGSRDGTAAHTTYIINKIRRESLRRGTWGTAVAWSGRHSLVRDQQKVFSSMGGLTLTLTWVLLWSLCFRMFMHAMVLSRTILCLCKLVLNPTVPMKFLNGFSKFVIRWWTGNPFSCIQTQWQHMRSF